ncbi:MAG TPA: 3-keto-5-aminohexanoate cleavage protein, partial [Planctomycetaceae bacterium]|nr:3-keto-5-aminohexanoate cleavage protein [Planctomycetaceae bacterium]
MPKVIITCAVTGAIHTPSMSPHLPVTPDQIAESAVGAAKAGASILHLHARDPQEGSPTPDSEIFRRFLPTISSQTDAVINITTGGAATMSIEERISGPLSLQPEMCSLNMGSMNFGLYPALDRFDQWQHEWEEPYLSGSRDRIFRNTFSDIETILERLGKGCGTRFEYECYDVGHLYNLAHFVDRGLIEAPFFVQTIFGVLGGIGPDTENLLHMRRIANKLFGDDYQWSILAAGRHQTSFVTTGAINGGHVRVGLEDNLYLSRGQLAESNAAQVSKIGRILNELSLEIATPAETREMLALKGAS